MGWATPVIELRIAPLLVEIIRTSFPSHETNRIFEFPLKVPRLELNLQSDRINSLVTMNSNLRLFYELSQSRFGLTFWTWTMKMRLSVLNRANCCLLVKKATSLNLALFIIWDAIGFGTLKLKTLRIPVSSTESRLLIPKKSHPMILVVCPFNTATNITAFFLEL